MAFPSLNGSIRNPLHQSMPGIWRAAEWYLDCRKQGYRVVAINSNEIKLTPDIKKSWFSTTLKVISYATLLLPAIAILVQRVYRLRNEYLVDDEIYVAFNHDEQVLKATIKQEIRDSHLRVQNCEEEHQETMFAFEVFQGQIQREREAGEQYFQGKRERLEQKYPHQARKKAHQNALPPQQLPPPKPAFDIVSCAGQAINLKADIVQFQLDVLTKELAIPGTIIKSTVDLLEQAHALVVNFCQIYDAVGRRKRLQQVDEEKQLQFAWENQRIPEVEARILVCAPQLHEHVISFIHDQGQNPFEALPRTSAVRYLERIALIEV